jgi:hypothetical protein
MPIVPNLEGLLPMPLLPPEELEKELHGNEENIDGWLKSFVCIYLYLRRKECVDCQEAQEGVCGLPRGASSPSLNRPPLKMEKWRVVKIRMTYASA